MGNLIKEFGVDCKMRTNACTIQRARRLSAKNSDFCVLETPKRGVFNGKLDCKLGSAEFFFCGRREQKVVFQP